MSEQTPVRATGLLGRFARFRRAAAIALLAAAVLPSAGCFGTFPVTNALYKFNDEVSDNKWVKTILLWVFGLFGVYGIGIFVDVVVLNLIEFWSGDPIDTARTWTNDDGTRITLAPGAAPNEAVLSVAKDSQLLSTRRFVRQADGRVDVFAEQGELVAYLRPAEQGRFNLFDASGNRVREIGAEDVAEVR